MSGPHDGPDAQRGTPDDDRHGAPGGWPYPEQYPQYGGAPWYGQPSPGGPQYPGGPQFPGGPQYPGGSQYPGAPQHPGAPQYPGGPQSPFPPGPPPFGAEPPRKRSWITWVAVASVLVVVLVAAVVVAALVVDSREIDDIDDAAVGNCITVSGTSDAATPHRADCGSDDFSFYVGQKVDENGQCADDYALHLTQRGKGRLCLTPNLHEGKCYSLPGQSGSVTDFAEVDCSATDLAFSKTVVKVQRRVESSAQGVCPTGEQLSYRRPTPVSYCADVVTSG